MINLIKLTHRLQQLPVAINTALLLLLLFGDSLLFAALSNPSRGHQGMFNLAVLVQRGHVVPLSVRGLFNVTSLDEQEVVVEKILQRCLFYFFFLQMR